MSQCRCLKTLSFIVLLAAWASSGLASQVSVVPINSEQFIQELKIAGLDVQVVRNSKKAALFKQAQQVLWLKTSRGIIEVAFYARVADANKVRITPLTNVPQGRYHYELREQPQLKEYLLDSNRPLFFKTYHNTLMVTAKPSLLDYIMTRLSSRQSKGKGT